MSREIRGADGFVLRILSEAPDELVMEASYPGMGGLPPEHFHPRQTERFEVLEGTMHAIVDGLEARYEAGESFTVPAGVVHQMATEGPARMRWEVRPALRTVEMFETLHGGRAGPGFLEEFAEEICLVPPRG